MGLPLFWIVPRGVIGTGGGVLAGAMSGEAVMTKLLPPPAVTRL
jgi:hypothetical protein